MKKSPSAKATVRSPIKEAKDTNNNNNSTREDLYFELFIQITFFAVEFR
jgi:hypothetical protein